MSQRPLLKILLYAVVPLLAILVAWLAGSLVFWYGGYPLYWRKPCYLMRPFPAGSCGSFYDWNAFVFDVLFYTTIGYTILFAYVVGDRQSQIPKPTAARVQT